MQQIFKTYLTTNAQEALKETIEKSNKKSLKKIKAKNLIETIKNQSGSLGNFLIKKTKNQAKKEDIKNNEKAELCLLDVVIKAFQSASLANNYYVGTEHLIFSYFKLLEEKQNILNASNKSGKNDWIENDNDIPGGHNNPNMFGEINALIGNFLSAGKNKSADIKTLNHFCVNLNEMARSQDHILIGRKNELERISNTLGRKMKNNPVLIGEPGVGKTAIVEGLARQINEGEAPFYLNNKKILTLDLGSLVAGTNFRGEFENRLKEVVEEAKNHKNIILFIDEIHNLIGAGSAVGGMDAANLLKPALSRGEIQIIGATTFEEYHKYVEKDAALERRLQPIVVNEPSQGEALKILKGIKKSYERYHQIKIDSDALEAAVNLAKKYLTNRYLPDSAIDLIDETSAKIRSNSQKHGAYNELQNKKNQLQELIDQKENLVLTDQYEEAIRMRDLEKKLEKEIEALRKTINNKQGPAVHITAGDVSQTLAQSMNLPLELLLKEKKSIPQQSKRMLKKNLFGQNHVIENIYKTLICQFSHLANASRPLGSFLFLGPSGVGKTLTAKLISQVISPGNENSLIQINMSEFMEKHTVSRLLGAPAGYVGYEESGEFLDKIRKNPYSIVLFDEIEKADQQVLNILLQILEEGEITSAKGQIINFKNTIIILTSNIGVNRLNKIPELGFGTQGKKIKNEIENTRENIQQDLEEILSNELLNRLDNILFFNHLNTRTVSKIVSQELDLIKERLKQQRIYFNFHQPAVKKIAKESLDFQQGARLAHRQIKQEVEPLLAEKLLAKKKYQKLTLTIKNKKLAVDGQN